MKKKIVLLLSILSASGVYGDSYKEQDWGIGASMRLSTIVYGGEDEYSQNFVPMLFFDNEHFYLRGIEAGVKLYSDESFRLSAITRVRYVDIAKEHQNKLQVDGNDIGLQLQYRPNDTLFIDIEAMDDLDQRFFSNLRVGADLSSGSLEYRPYATLQYSSAKFNSYYYGMGEESIEAGANLSLGVESKFHVASNFYLLARFQSTYLSSLVRESSYVEETLDNELYLGIGFFNQKDRPKQEELSNTPYIRVAHGWATPSNISEIIRGDTQKDIYNNRLSSLFYGYPLTDELFSLPLDIYLTSGFVLHHSSEVQDMTQEYLLAIKAYYTIPLPWELRIGAAEGFSYISDITYIEESEMQRKEYIPSNLLNYLDFSLDLNVGSVFGESLEQLWIGYGLHHRSAIFESSSRFGRIKGGSNYNSIYLQWHY